MTNFEEYMMFDLLTDEEDEVDGCTGCTGCGNSTLLGMLVVVLCATVFAFLANVFAEWNFWLSFIGFLVAWSLKTILKGFWNQRKTH